MSTGGYEPVGGAPLPGMAQGKLMSFLRFNDVPPGDVSLIVDEYVAGQVSSALAEDAEAIKGELPTATPAGVFGGGLGGLRRQERGGPGGAGTPGQAIGVSRSSIASAGRGRDEERDDAAPDLWDDGAEWVDDEGMGPSVMR